MVIENPIKDDTFNVQEYLDGVFDILSIEVFYEPDPANEKVKIVQIFHLLKTNDGPNRWCAHLKNQTISYRYYKLDDEEYPSQTVIDISNDKFKVVDFGEDIKINNPFSFKTTAFETLVQPNGDFEHRKELVFNVSRIYGKPCEDFTLTVNLPKGYVPLNSIPKASFDYKNLKIIHSAHIKRLVPYNFSFVIKKSKWAILKAPTSYISIQLLWSLISAAIGLLLGILYRGGQP